jgi:hypothetical protein
VACEIRIIKQNMPCLGTQIHHFSDADPEMIAILKREQDRMSPHRVRGPEPPSRRTDRPSLPGVGCGGIRIVDGHPVISS